MTGAIDDRALDRIFREARTHNAWLEKPLSVDRLKAVWDLARMGPTSANCSPARIVFVISAEAKARLKPCLDAGNAAKTMAAPATAIIGYDLKFYDRLPQLFPHADARAWFAGDEPLIRATAFRNSSLQGAYFILAARALGIDRAPMSGFSEAEVNDAFFTGTDVKANFLCNLGYGSGERIHPRSPRLDFNDACSIV
jgi:3-hydroxypropanoate dehydrogenase